MYRIQYEKDGDLFCEFCQTRRGAERLAANLRALGYHNFYIDRVDY